MQFVHKHKLHKGVWHVIKDLSELRLSYEQGELYRLLAIHMSNS